MLLLVAATSRELAPLQHAVDGSARTIHGITVVDGSLDGVDVRLAVTGFARAATAASLSRLLLDTPQAVVQVGVGGSFDARVPVGGVAVAEHDTYADLGVRTSDGWIDAEALGLPTVPRPDTPLYDRFPCHPAASRAAATAIGAPLGPFVTVETVTGNADTASELAARHDPLIESMEGAAAAHVCAIDDLAFVQIRAASNEVGARDRGAWRLDEAIAAAAAAARTALPAILEVLP